MNLLCRTVPFFLVLFAVSGCHTAAPWSRTAPLVADGIHYWVEPGIESYVTTRLADMAEFKQWLSASLFPGQSGGPVRIVFYRDHSSYARYRPESVDSLAHFHLKTAVIHLPVDIPEEGWKHELVHAVLHERWQNYPFWAQEGAALLFQSADPRRPLCDTALRLPASLTGYRERLLRLRLPLPLRRDVELNRKGIYEETALAGYFAYFLWQRRQLLPYLRKAAESERDSFLLLLGGDYRRLKMIEMEFYEWLSSPLAIRPQTGC